MNGEKGMKYPSGEVFIKFEEILEDCKNIGIWINCSSNDNILESIFRMESLHNRGLELSQVIIPYMMYSRGDKLENCYCPAKVIAQLIPSYVKQITLYHLHNTAIVNYFNCPAVDIRPIEFIPQEILQNKVLVATDLGSAKDIIAIANKYNLEYCIAIKQRNGENNKLINFIGNVDPSKEYLIIDDIIDSGKTLINVIEALKERGATKINGWVTHAVLSSTEAIPMFDKLYLSNTVDCQDKIKDFKNVEIVNIV